MEELTQHLSGLDDTLEPGQDILQGRVTRILDFLKEGQGIEDRTESGLVRRAGADTLDAEIAERNTKFTRLDLRLVASDNKSQ